MKQPFIRLQLFPHSDVPLHQQTSRNKPFLFNPVEHDIVLGTVLRVGRKVDRSYNAASGASPATRDSNLLLGAESCKQCLTIHYCISDPASPTRLQSDSSSVQQDSTANSLYVAFRSKVVSRTHAEIWVGRDGQWKESRPYLLKSGDVIQLGVDYQGRSEGSFSLLLALLPLQVRNSALGTGYMFQCPMCRQVANLDASTATEMDDASIIIEHEQHLIHGLSESTSDAFAINSTSDLTSNMYAAPSSSSVIDHEGTSSSNHVVGLAEDNTELEVGSPTSVHASHTLARKPKSVIAAISRSDSEFTHVATDGPSTLSNSANRASNGDSSSQDTSPNGASEATMPMTIPTVLL
ncbi:hypothetical protein BSLG_005703 [Batrachochytrium salamandrivorans]|nr:hypothetical protein BSLG_005703 [Batrachochytrium salamandrivorans]